MEKFLNIGWGRTRHKGNLSTVLREVTVPVSKYLQLYLCQQWTYIYLKYYEREREREKERYSQTDRQGGRETER